jgi:hypothetical protein
MRWSLVTGGLVMLALGATVSAAHAAAAPTPLAAKLTSCTTGAAATDRAATFTASMPATAATRRMWMRFELLEQRDPAGEPVSVQGVPGWGVWQKSEPGRPGLIITKRVEQLAAPATYRAVVRFRWYSKGGRLLRSTARTTATCEQPDMRPDLVAGRLSATVRDQSTAAYQLTVRNAGAGDSPAFGIVLTVDGRQVAPVAAGPLPAAASEVVTIVGPHCTPGGIVLIAVDAGGAVDEVHEHDTLVSRACPLPFP